MLDFAPSILAPFLILLFLCVRRCTRVIHALLMAWICCQFAALYLHSGNNGQRTAWKQDESFSLQSRRGRKITSFNGAYSLSSHPTQTQITYNGTEWEPDGLASPVVTLALDAPDFLEIAVGPRTQQEGADAYRAKIGNLELPIESISHSNGKVGAVQKVRFSIPESIRHQQGDQLIFLCFTTGWSKSERESKRPLYSVRWK